MAGSASHQARRISSGTAPQRVLVKSLKVDENLDRFLLVLFITRENLIQDDFRMDAEQVLDQIILVMCTNFVALDGGHQLADEPPHNRNASVACKRNSCDPTEFVILPIGTAVLLVKFESIEKNAPRSRQFRALAPACSLN